MRRPTVPDLPAGTITLLFTDMEGSTHLLQQVGEGYAALLEECRRLLRTAFGQWRGQEVDTQGDAFFVAFARASDAVCAAVAIQRALTAHSWPQDAVVQVRIGLHTGEPRRSAEGYVGLDVHHAARIMSAGHGGQILLSQATSVLVEQSLPGGVQLQDLGEHRLKDLRRPSRLFQLVVAGLPTAFPPLHTLDSHPNNLPIAPTPFIGREREVAALSRLLARSDVRLLTLTGPAGVGKTRLALQVAAEVSDGYADGVFVVPLAPVTDPEQVMEAIAQVLSIPDVSGPSLLGQVQRALKSKQLLLVLDNFEQVASAALMVAELLATCPSLKIVVTSRVALHVRAWMDSRWPSNWRRPEPSTTLRRCYWPAWNRVSPFSAGARVICRLASRRCGQPLPGATSYSRSRNSCSSGASRSLSMGGTGRPLPTSVTLLTGWQVTKRRNWSR
jgi:class 3 adenylate cyclase